MKRLISLLLALILLVTVESAFADGVWYCPECGAKNDGNFCPNDGTKRPETIVTDSGTSFSSSDLKVDSVTMKSDGSVTVSWSGGKAPYTVCYQHFANNNHNAGSDMILFPVSSGLSSNQLNSELFIPGDHCWVIVIDADNNQAWYDYNEYASAFSRANCSYHFSLRTHRNNRSSMVDYFSSRNIESEFSYNLYGADIKINPKISQDLTMMIRMAITIPSGEPVLMHVERATIVPRAAYYIWKEFDFKYLWNTLMREKGTIPSGTYTFRLFCDNEYLFSQDFVVD